MLLWQTWDPPVIILCAIHWSMQASIVFPNTNLAKYFDKGHLSCMLHVSISLFLSNDIFFARKEKYHAHTCVWKLPPTSNSQSSRLCYLTAYFLYNIIKYFWIIPLLTASSEGINIFYYLRNQLPSNHKHPFVVSWQKTHLTSIC